MMPHTMCTQKDWKQTQWWPPRKPAVQGASDRTICREALQVHQKGMTFDAFFAELAEGGSIKHEALCKRLDLGFRSQHSP